MFLLLVALVLEVSIADANRTHYDGERLKNYFANNQQLNSGELSKWNVASSNGLAHGFRVTKKMLFNLVVQEGKLKRMNAVEKPYVETTTRRNFSENYQQNNISEEPQKFDKYNKKSGILIQSNVRETLVKREQSRKARLHKCVLLRHVHDYTGEKPYECQQCGKTFSQKKGLDVHAIVHTLEKCFKCEQCDKRFGLRGNLIKHMVVHTGERKFKCAQCSKDFTEKGSLVKHMLVHTGERKFKCEQCDKDFSQKGSLKRHAVIHSGERKFKCEQCNKDFFQKGCLVRHMAVHFGGRKFKCEQCDKRFTRKWNLVQHMLVHRREKNSKVTKNLRI